MIYLMWV